MTKVDNRDPVEVVGEAYELMLETILKGLHIREHTEGPTLSELIEQAKKEAVIKNNLPEEHAKNVAQRLKRIFEKNRD